MLKIRLQLQIHSLADPFDLYRPQRGGPSTVQTFQEILQHEGVTVSTHCFSASTELMQIVGLLERQCSCRAALHNLWCHSILDLSSNFANPPASSGPRWCTSFHLWSSSRRFGYDFHLPFRFASHPLCGPGSRSDLSQPTECSTLYRVRGRPARLLSRTWGCCQCSSAIYGSLLLRI